MVLCPQYGSLCRRNIVGNITQKLLAIAASPILAIIKCVNTVAYRRGLQMATYLSNAMASRMVDSAMKLRCVKNIWVRQAWKDIPLERDQKMLRVLGTVEEDNTRSATANMARKRYIGLWRLRSLTMTNKRMKLPRSAAMYIRQNGMESQMCRSSRPAMPSRRKKAGCKLVWLRAAMVG